MPGSFLTAVAERAISCIESVRSIFEKHSNLRSILIAAGLAFLFWGGYVRLVAPPDAFPLGALVTVPEGATLSGAADALLSQHVIKSRTMFIWSQRILGRQASMHAGDYQFRQPLSVFAVGDAVAYGAFGLEPLRLRVPEGATVREIAILAGKRLERFDEERFIELALPQEGTLFPDTYFFMPNADEQTVLDAMTANFDEKIAPIIGEIESSGRTLQEIIIMASIL